MDGLKIYRDYEVFYSNYDFPTVEEAIKHIHMCGGKAVLAHPGKYPTVIVRWKRLLLILRSY